MAEPSLKSRFEATQQTVKFFETLLDATADGIMITDSGQNIIVANDAFSTLFGHRSREVIETNVYTWIEQLDGEAIQRWAELEQKVSHNGICRNVEFQMTTKEGLKHLSVNASLLERIANEERGVIISIWRDTTNVKQADEALRESEERFRLAFENANDGVCLVDTDGNLVRVNKRMCDIFGYSKKELESMTVNDIAHPEDSDISPKFIEKSISGEVESTVFEKRYFHQQGHIIWGQVSSSMIKNAKGDPLYFISHVQDITQRKQTEEELKALLEDKLILLRELYHRTKNNMQVIIAMLHLQSQNIEDDNVLEIFKETENRIKSMALVHEKLYQTKNLSRVDLKEYFNDLLSLLVRSYKDLAGGITINTDMESVSVTIDYAIPCGLIINEIISNSFKHAFSEGKKGEIRIGLKLQADGEIEIRVSDDGAGMPEGFDYREASSFGIQTIIALTEHQLQGKLDLNTDKGTEFQIRFKDSGYQERV